LRRLLVVIALVCSFTIFMRGTLAWALDLSAITQLPFLASAQLAVESTPYAGITFYRLEQTTPRPLLIHILEVDLTNPSISLDLLLGNHVLTSPRTLTSMVDQEQEVIAATNSDFFYISSTQSPVGLAIKEGVVLKGDHPDLLRPCLGWDQEGRGHIGYWSWEGILRLPTSNESFPIAAFNDIYLPSNGLVMYNSYWGTRVPQNIVQQAALAVSIKEDTVQEIRQNPNQITINPDTTYLLAFGPMASQLLTLIAPGSKVEIEEVFYGPAGLKLAVCGFPMLVEEGRILTDFPDWLNGPNPRTAAGLNEEGTALTLMVVDGRSQISHGMTLDELAQFSAALGLYSALNFDGGGSSTMVMRQPLGQAMVLNNLPDNVQRAIPIALALRSVPVVIDWAEIWSTITAKYSTHSLLDFTEEAITLSFAPNSIQGELLITQGPVLEDGTTALAARLDFVPEATLRRRELSLDLAEPVELPENARQLGAWVYAEIPAPYAIEATITDKEGTAHRLVLTETIDWTGWLYISAELPDAVPATTFSSLHVIIPPLKRGELTRLYFQTIMVGVDDEQRPTKRWELVP